MNICFGCKGIAGLSETRMVEEDEAKSMVYFGGYMKRIIALIICVLLISVCIGAYALQLETDAIDIYVESVASSLTIPNVSIGIVKDGEVLYLRDFGEKQKNALGGKAIAYPIGSISKVFTALAARQLIGAGMLVENAPVERYLPHFRTEYLGKNASVTVGQLIRHTSGISAIDGGRPFIYNTRHDLSQVVERSMHLKLVSKPGVQYNYSNLNYLLLGRIVELVSQTPYDAYVHDKILKPLHMTGTNPNAASMQTGDYMKGHIPFYGTTLPVSYAFSSSIMPTGGFISTAEDICRLMIFYQQGGRIDGDKLIDSSTVLGWESAADNGYYDIYWTKADWKPGLRFIHNGSWPGYSSTLTLDADSGYGIVVLTNSYDQWGIQLNEPAPWGMAEDILSYLTEGTFPERKPISYDYSDVIWLACLFAGLIWFVCFMICREIKASSRQKGVFKDAIMLSIYLGLPMLWIIFVPAINDGKWDWLLASNPQTNISLLGIMAALVLVGIGKLLIRTIRTFPSKRASA